MRYRRLICYWAVGLVGLATTCTPALAEESPLRVAVINAGGGQAVPAALVDLLVVELSDTPGIELLERQEIARILREQQVHLQLVGDSASQGIVSAGKILGAQALVMLWADPENNQVLPVHVRIVETTRGIRFGETILAWSEDPQAVGSQLQSAGEQIANRLHRIQNAQDGLTVVSIAGFQTNELSQDAHHVRRELESWLEAWLAGQPGIAVAERAHVLPLIEERKLAGDLPEAIGESDAIVDGHFQIDFSQKEPQLRLTVRLIRKDRTISQKSLQGSFSDLPKLRHAAGTAILTFLSPASQGIHFDSQTEAQLLSQSAERLLSVGRSGEAFTVLTRAYALEPDDYRVQVLLLKVGVCADYDKQGKVLLHQFYPQALVLSDVAQKVVNRIRHGQEPPGKAWYYQDNSILEAVFSLCRRFASLHFDNQLPPTLSAEHEWLRTSIQELYLNCLAATETRTERAYLSALRLGMNNGHYWCKTPEDALAMRRELLDRAFDAYQKQKVFIEILAQGGTFRLDCKPSWKENRDLPQIYKHYLEELAKSDRPFYRARAARGLAEWAVKYQNDRELAAAYYQRFIDILVDEIVPATPEHRFVLGDDWLDYYHYYDHFLTDEQLGKHWSRVIRACWSRGSPRSSQSWEMRINQTAARLEKAGQVELAKALLQECVGRLEADTSRLQAKQKQAGQWPSTAARLKILLSELASRHPQADDDSASPADIAVSCEVNLTVQHLAAEIRKADIEYSATYAARNPDHPKYHPNEQFLQHSLRREWHFLGAIPTDEGHAVICGRGHFVPPNDPSGLKPSMRLILARTDKQGAFKSATPYPGLIERGNAPSLREHHLLPIASDGEDVFVGCSSGLVWFRKSKPPVHFSSKYLGQASPLQRPSPFDNVHEMVCLGSKLIVKGSTNPWKPKIYELDYRKGTSTELWDAQNLAADSPFAGRKGFSMMAGPNDLLLVWARPDHTKRKAPPNAAGGDLFLVDLDDKSIRQSDEPLFLSFMFYRIFGDYQPYRGIAQAIGYGSVDGDLAIFHPRTAVLHWFVATDQVKKSPPKLVRAGLAANDHWLLASQKRSGNSVANDWNKYFGVIVKFDADDDFQWMLYQQGNPTPKRLTAPNLPSPDKVKQFFIDEQGQVLMLTSKELLRVEIPSAAKAAREGL